MRFPLGITFRLAPVFFLLAWSAVPVPAIAEPARELIPNEKLRYTARFDDANLPGEMETTVTLRAVPVGVELRIVQAGIPDVIPTEACYLGWQESLQLLTLLVEPEIQG